MDEFPPDTIEIICFAKPDGNGGLPDSSQHDQRKSYFVRRYYISKSIDAVHSFEMPLRKTTDGDIISSNSV